MQGLLNNSWTYLAKKDILQGFESSYAYEVVRLIETCPLFLDLHYQRLIKTCDSLNISSPEYRILENDIVKLVEQNQLKSINIKIAIDKRNYAVFPIPSKYPSGEDYLRGVSCSILSEERENPEIKAFQAELREKSDRQISQQEIYESVLVNRNGKITEGSRSSLFFIKGTKIYTAPDQLVLAGITRLKVLELCNDLNLNIEYKAISTDELPQIDASFICGTSPGILPVSNIESFKFDIQNHILQQIHNLYHSKYLSNFQL